MDIFYDILLTKLPAILYLWGGKARWISLGCFPVEKPVKL